MSAQAEMPSATRTRSLAFQDGPAAILMAGMRARRVADLCAAEGLAAVLLDGAGRVLHVGKAAEALLGRELRVEADHILGEDDQANAAIEAVLNPILGRSREGTQCAAAPVTRAGRLALTALDYADDHPAQLLRAVFLIGETAGPLAEAAGRLRL